MIRLKRYYTALHRYKHSKGFGIHSPFAFYFVTRVLCERCPYYAYENILAHRQLAIRLASHVARHPRIISLKNAKMLFRITCYFSPKMILQIGTSYGVSTTAMLDVSSCSRLFIFTGDNPHNKIYEQVTNYYKSRITTCPTVQDAIICYNEVKGEEVPFILVNSIDTTDEQYAIDAIIDAINHDGTIIIRNLGQHESMQRLWDKTKDAMTHGISFSNERLVIILGLHHLPLQHILLWF